MLLRFNRTLFLLGTIVLATAVHATPGASQPGTSIVPLKSGWSIKSSCDAKDTGPAISMAGYAAGGWTATTIPHTVLGARVDAGEYSDPFFGKNLLNIPGTDYPVGKIYANLPMTVGSPYNCSWWYRTEFMPPFSASTTTWLHFNGINYRANVWVNGSLVAAKDDIAGAFRSYEFDISKYLVEGKKNALAVEVFAQTENDLGISFIDWNPAPADKSLGLWRDVYLSASGPVTLRFPEVITHFADDQLSAADLTIVADVSNTGSEIVQGTVAGEIGAIRFEQPLQLNPGEKKIVRFSPQQFPQLHVNHPQIWWPYQYGKPQLQTLRVAFRVNGTESDAQTVRFGIREVEGSLNDKGYLQFRMNRRNILIRGGGWNPDMFYRESRERMRQELAYVKHMNLNTIRLEGKLGSEDMFDLADEMGVLIMAGWPCCDHWEHWDKWTPADHEIAKASLASQISRLRVHPSVFVWLNGSDGPPPADVEQDYIAGLKERDWANPYISSASATLAKFSGPSGVKMSGPYDYVPPEYWTLDKDKHGGAYGFNTETSAGPAIPGVESIRRTLPKESWWPQDDVWNYHAGMGKFAQYNLFNSAMNATYGEPADLDDYTRKAQMMAYDNERAMFEAYGGNKYTSTGVIQWMLNNAWPSFIWHLYDYYLVPGGGYFGTRKAGEPLHVQYRYADRSIQVVNSQLRDYSGLKVEARLFSLDGKELFSHRAAVQVASDGVTACGSLPEQSATTFLKLDLRDASGKTVSTNFYWLPAKLAQLDWEKSNYFYTPGNPYADMRDLRDLPKASVRAVVLSSPGEIRIRLTNSGKNIAFFLHAQVMQPNNDQEIAPVFWNDNFISLLPGESRELDAKFASTSNAKIVLDGWNVAEQRLRQQPRHALPMKTHPTTR